jgi:hypothetical protein
MAKLSSDQRGNLSPSSFALPGGRFPIPDASHAHAALSGASRSEAVGNISPAQKAVVDAKANAKLGNHHPREHSLAMASADHLHKGGYISSGTRDSIRAKASAALDAHKAAKPVPIPYGSLAPK